MRAAFDLADVENRVDGVAITSLAFRPVNAAISIDGGYPAGCCTAMSATSNEHRKQLPKAPDIIEGSVAASVAGPP
jgi:hypothetical protein